MKPFYLDLPLGALKEKIRQAVAILKPLSIKLGAPLRRRATPSRNARFGNDFLRPLQSRLYLLSESMTTQFFSLTYNTVRLILFPVESILYQSNTL